MKYINILINHCKRDEHILLATLLFALTTINPLANLLFHKIIFLNLFGIDSRITLFITMYVIGAYFGKYGIKINKFVALLCYFLISLPIFLLIVYHKINLLNFIELTLPTTILAAVFLFIFFAKLDVKIKIINTIGGLVYGAYIIHVFYISYLQGFISFTNYFNKNYYFLVDIGFILIVAVASLATEYIRKKIFESVRLLNTNKLIEKYELF